jgi:GrpB-like predicted nucleotidyltransferase (UPF0157 family)/predicted kinase
VPRRRSDRAIYLVTGPMAAGKSTVARLLAERFVRGVHVEGDAFRRSIVSGRVEMTPDLAPEALRQLRLRYRLGATVADAYFEAGYAVALEDVVAGPPLADYAAAIRGCPLHVVVLLPSAAVVAARAAARRQGGYGRWSIDELYRGFTAETPRIGIWLDTSEQTPAETVEAILARTPPVAEPVVVTDYDPAWPRRFEERAASIRAALGDLAVAVEHAGSTAVPGLAAKPVLDIDIVVGSAGDVRQAIERLRALGYEHEGDLGVPGREAFAWPPGTERHHVYVVVAGGRPHAEHVRFRDYLRAHPDVARDYAALKRTLAGRHRDDRDAYTEAKAAFIADVLRAAGR